MSVSKSKKYIVDMGYREVVMSISILIVVSLSLILYPGSGNLTEGLRGSVDVADLFLFGLVVTLGAAVKGVSGFGYAVITTPIAATIIDPTIAIVVLSVPPLMLNIFQVGETNTGLRFIREEWSLILLALIGSFIGVYFLTSFETGPVIPFIMGIVVLGYVVFQVFQKFVVIEKADHPVLKGLIGVLEGFFLGAANLGPLLPAYLHTFERDTERYIGGLSIVFTFIFAQRIIQMLFSGLMTSYLLWLGSTISIITLVGLGIGTILRKLEINQELFNWIVAGILFVISMNIFRNTLPAIIKMI